MSVLSTGETTPSKPFKILSLDGGGVRAVIQAGILARLVKEYPTLIDDVDMFTGASAGSIVALALACGLTPEKTKQVWEASVAKIFSEGFVHRIETIDYAFGATYSNTSLKGMLQETLGDKTLAQLSKKMLVPAFSLDPNSTEEPCCPSCRPSKPSSSTVSAKAVASPPRQPLKPLQSSPLPLDSFVCISSSNSTTNSNTGTAVQVSSASMWRSWWPSWSSPKPAPTSPTDVAAGLPPSSPHAAPAPRKRWMPEFFHNFPHSTNADTTCLDVCLRTTAAPTYFPIYEGYVDGGTFANNPALVAATTAICSGVRAQDIVVFSISTGNNPKCITKSQYGTGNWGLYEWGPHIIDLLLDSGTACVDYQCGCLLGKNYHRLDPVLPTTIALDDVSAIPVLEELANTIDLSETKRWLEGCWIKGPPRTPSPVEHSPVEDSPVMDSPVMSAVNDDGTTDLTNSTTHSSMNGSHTDASNVFGPTSNETDDSTMGSITTGTIQMDGKENMTTYKWGGGCTIQ